MTAQVSFFCCVLNALKGNTVISADLKEVLDISKGVLATEVKNWNGIPTLIKEFFDHIEDYDVFKKNLLNAVIVFLENLSKLKLIDENRKKKNGSNHLDSINNLIIMVPQASLPEPLNVDITSMINKFTRAVEYHTDDMLLAPNKIEHINIVSLLNTTFFNNRKESDTQQFNYQHYEAPEELKNMENDFKIKYVVSFTDAVFDINDNFVVFWDPPLDIYLKSNMKIQQRQTTDAKFKTINGMEIGIVEIKPFNTPAEVIEEYRIRLAEISKKMLHKRILNAKSERELRTFAIMIAGLDVEYFVHEYNSENAKKYTFRLLKKSTLPTFSRTFSSMSLSLESLYHFKKMMTDSLASPADLEKPYIYSNKYNGFKPKVSLLKLNDD